MKTYAAILAAGSGSRFGSDKTQVTLGRIPLWRWSFDAYAKHPEISGVVIVGSAENLHSFGNIQALAVVEGGASRRESAWAAIEALPEDAEALLIHDAARPFVTAALISKVADAVREHGAAAAATAVTDTIKHVEAGMVRDVPRDRLVAMQTPQGATVEIFRRAHSASSGQHTDDMGLLEAIGVEPAIVGGDVQNFKITTPEDLARARAVIGSPETRTGLGYDIHPFSNDTDRSLFLGGIHFPDHLALEGHSDADVLLHAITDALLGAANLGDIGVHFPNTDTRWKGESSLTFLRHAAALVLEAGWAIVNIDSTVIAESPKVMRRAEQIRSTIAQAISIDVGRISVKATTNERLGAIGRSEGIAAFATATLRERI